MTGLSTDSGAMAATNRVAIASVLCLLQSAAAFQAPVAASRALRPGGAAAGFLPVSRAPAVSSPRSLGGKPQSGIPSRGASGTKCSLTSDGLGGERMKGVLKVTDAVTGAPVYLVGAMHYNPVSIRRTRLTVQELANAGELSAVVIESCASRWNSTMNQPTWVRNVLQSEMGAAAKLAQQSGAELVLGDQPIEETSQDMGDTLKMTVEDLKSPLSGGWGRIATDVARAGKATFSPRKEGTGLGVGDILDPALIAATPVTFLRYPLAWLIRAPQAAFTFVTATVVISLVPDVANALILSAADDPDSVTNVLLAYLTGFAFTTLELVFIVRLFLVALLDTRNEILATNIREACARAGPAAPGGRAPAVVAVLGMAHVNGVQRMLEDTAAPKA